MLVKQVKTYRHTPSASSGDAAEFFSNLKTPIIKMYKRLITTILALAALTANAQTVIEGTVTDSLGHAVDAYVTVAPKGTGNILGFADTDAKGYYKLSFTSTADTLVVTAAGLSVGNVSRIVANKSQRQYTRVNYSGLDIYTNTSQLRPRNIIGTIRFKPL